jgi:hypothetical protein
MVALTLVGLALGPWNVKSKVSLAPHLAKKQDWKVEKTAPPQPQLRELPMVPRLPQGPQWSSQPTQQAYLPMVVVTVQVSPLASAASAPKLFFARLC